MASRRRRTRERGGPLLLAAALAVLGTTPAAAEEAERCLACHAPAIDPACFAGSAHAALGCAACHADVEGYPHPDTIGRPECATCHAEVVAAHRGSAHGRAGTEGRPAAGCVDCHGDVHAVRPRTDAASPVNWSKLAGTCARCHADAQLAERYRIPVARPIEAYLESAHARAVAAGRRAAVCSDCHGSHAIQPGRDPRSSLWRTSVPATCGACHAASLAAFRESVHGEAVERGVRDAPVCTDCHGEHRILGHTDPASPVFAANVPGETCGPCHASTRLSERYGLPREQVATFSDSYHGLALRAGQLTVANCASCHGVHDIHPAADPRSHVHPANLPSTCGRCHPGAGARFSLGPVHFLMTAAPVQMVRWIRALYLWLIGVVIGSMAFHNLLDLLRKARRPALPQPTVAGDRPERMPRALRWQHGLVMLSFAVLAYTGFALKYPESAWASPLLRFETSLGLRGLLHRVAAVVLLASLAWHLVELVVSPRRRACLSGLRWSRRDAREVLGALAWYLGWRPGPPARGSFGYVEKVEYWAFLWGTAVMTASGLILWFESAALRWLPKWATDVATAVHFYEAVLATLAILVWHLYWVIFEPDVYPMDASWWHGRAPAARALERGEGTAAEPDGPPRTR
jgi:cytochrome b subunit of formate dehydrogenase